MKNCARLLAFAFAIATLPCGLPALTVLTPFWAASRNPDAAVSPWPAPARTLARAMIAKYGPPDSFDERALYWRDNGPWARTVVHRGPKKSSIFRQGEDFIEQGIVYPVPADCVDALESFDAGVAVNRETGELSSRSTSEAMNFLAVNLAADIVTRARSVREARAFLRRTRRLAESGKGSSYLEGLNFDVQTGRSFNQRAP